MGDRETYVDGDRVVDFSDDDTSSLPESTRDDTEGWRQPAGRDDDRILEERPPHWD